MAFISSATIQTKAESDEFYHCTEAVRALQGAVARFTSFLVKLAALKVDGDFRALCEASVLYPKSGGNIHSFTALTSCAMLDVLSPPYSGEPSYYRQYPYPDLPGNEDGDSEEYVWLEQRNKPKSFCLIPHPYRSPTIDFT